jgi:hypothetical protein
MLLDRPDMGDDGSVRTGIGAPPQSVAVRKHPSLFAAAQGQAPSFWHSLQDCRIDKIHGDTAFTLNLKL